MTTENNEAILALAHELDFPALNDWGKDRIVAFYHAARKPLEEEIERLKESYANSESRADYNQEERKRLIAKKDSLHKECAARTEENRQLRQQLADKDEEILRLKHSCYQEHDYGQEMYTRKCVVEAELAASHRENKLLLARIEELTDD